MERKGEQGERAEWSGVRGEVLVTTTSDAFDSLAVQGEREAKWEEDRIRRAHVCNERSDVICPISGNLVNAML